MTVSALLRAKPRANFGDFRVLHRDDGTPVTGAKLKPGPAKKLQPGIDLTPVQNRANPENGEVSLTTSHWAGAKVRALGGQKLAHENRTSISLGTSLTNPPERNPARSSVTNLKPSCSKCSTIERRTSGSENSEISAIGTSMRAKSSACSRTRSS